MKVITTSEPAAEQAADLRVQLVKAQEDLITAEAELAREQAAVNAFRMHARLMLDDLVDAISGLRAEKQSLLTRLALNRQAALDEEDESADQARETSEEAHEEVLGPTSTPRDKAAEKRLYRELARRFHPDLAESAAELAYRTSVMATVNTAFAAGDIHALYDLAGELEPGEIVELSGIKSREIRQLRERLLQCRRRRRKVARQLQVLRRDNTARLWQRAQDLGNANDNWWAAVRRDLEVVKARLVTEVNDLAAQVEAPQDVAAPTD